MERTSRVQEIDSLPPEKKAMINRLRRVEGQLRGIQRMIEENSPCGPILVQLSAARRAMHQACIEVLKGHLKGCLTRGQAPDPKELEQLIGALLELAPAGDQNLSEKHE